MNNMKNIKYALIALAITVMYACNDSFFDQVPNDRITMDLVFSKKQYSEEYLAKVYAYIVNEGDKNHAVPWESLSDDMELTWATQAPSYMNIGKWSAVSDYFLFWINYYQGIRSATYFMNRIGENQELIDMGRSDLIVQYRAEARFLRAWFYYNILKQYGPCMILSDDVIPPDISADDPAMDIPRNSFDECVDYIVQELNLAAKDLPEHFTSQPDNDYGRATQAWCIATKSRLLLLAASPQYNGNTMYSSFKNKDGKQLINTTYDNLKWKKAADAAKELINMGLFDLFKIYKSDNTIDPYLSCRNVYFEAWNSEVIMSRNNTPALNLLREWEKASAPRFATGYSGLSVTQQLVDEFETSTGKRIDEPGTDYQEEGFTDGPISFSYNPVWKMYANREPRFYVNVAFSGSKWIFSGDNNTQIELFYEGNSGKKGTHDYSKTGYLCLKNIHPDTDTQNNVFIGRPTLMMRYTEILLNYIEALNEYDPGNSDIRYYLNLIRERAGLPGVPAGLNQEDMQERIRHERRVELCFECIRYFDTRRWLIAEKVNGGDFFGMNVDEGTSLSDRAFYERTVIGRRVFKKAYYLFPIPQAEMDRVKSLVQNPGWDN